MQCTINGFDQAVAYISNASVNTNPTRSLIIENHLALDSWYKILLIFVGFTCELKWICLCSWLRNVSRLFHFKNP